MYQHSTRSKSPAGATFVSPATRNSPLLNHNSASSLTSSASFNNQNYNAYQHTPYQYGHLSNYQQARAMPRSVSNPPSPAHLRPHSLYSLSVMPPVNRNTRNNSYEDHGRTPILFSGAYSSSQPPSPIIRSPSESTFDTASLSSHDRRQSLSGSTEGLSSSFSKPDRYHRRRKTSESISNASTAATSVASSPEVKAATINSTSKSSIASKGLKSVDNCDSTIYRKNIKASQSTPSLSKSFNIPPEAPQYNRAVIRERPNIHSRRHSSFAVENAPSTAPSTLQLPSDSRRRSYLANQTTETKQNVAKDMPGNLAHRRTSSFPNTKTATIPENSQTNENVHRTPEKRVSSTIEKPIQQLHSSKSEITLPKSTEITSKAGPPIKNTPKTVEKPINQTPVEKEVPVQKTAAFTTSPKTVRMEKEEKTKSLGSKLKKVFSFGGKARPSSYAESTDAAKKKRSFSSLSGLRKNSDTKSIYSVKSNMSTASFATLRKVGSSIARNFTRNKDLKIMTPTTSPTDGRSLLSPTAEPVVTHAVAEAEINTKSPPIVTPAASKETISTEGTEESNDKLEDKSTEEKDGPPSLRVDSPEAIPSLTSSSASDTIENNTPIGSDPKLEESMVEGDTIFPKSLDLLTVNTIRSSLDRVKSLERKRSRRSSSGKQQAEETLPNQTTVHVHKDPTAVDPPADVSAPRSILKSATGSIKSISSAKSYEKNDEKDSNRTRSLTPSDIDLTNLVQIGSDNFLDLEHELETFETTSFGEVSQEKADSVEFKQVDTVVNQAEESPVQQEELFEDAVQPDNETEDLKDYFVDAKQSEHEVMEIDEPKESVQVESTPVEVDTPQTTELEKQESMDDLDMSESGVEYEESLTSPVNQPTEYSMPLKEPHRKKREHAQYHYHPIYQQRMMAKNRAFVGDEHRRTPSFASSSSSSAGRYSTPQRHSTDCDEESLKTPVSQAKNSFVSFSSRISIYDTYGRGDYDRRPDLATCNRLTPVLAQRIKEEINTFKMEMEVHNDSRRYTHFL